MASLIIQDTFEPYYAGRENDAKTRAKLQPAAKKPVGSGGEAEIVLPSNPAPRPEVRPRDGRRTVQH